MTNLTNILSKLTALIEKNKTYIVDGSLNRNLLAADARKYDSELLNLLQKDKELKEHFFAATDGGLVFKKDVFLQFIMNKEFLPDSYTKYKIKIGLGAEDGSLLSESGDVVLNWPYKDAILEGGQDKEDQKRSEVFFNEVLAPEQITRLLDKKVFTNWKRYDEDGEHDLDGLKDDDNLIIRGNNLVVLHSLKKRYGNKVKLIYIDPPYNTGSDSFGYNDRFNHSTWLTFMKNRLEVARELLAPDGFIFVQCDNNEAAYLTVLMDQIFGRENHTNSIVWKRTFSHGDIGQGAKHLGRLHDTILLYSRSDTSKMNAVFVPYGKEYEDKHFNLVDESGRRFQSVSLTAPGGASKGNPLYEFLGIERYWQYSKQNMEKLREKGYIYQSKPGSVPRKKMFLDEAKGVPIQDMWLDISPLQGGSLEKLDLMGQKPEKLMERIISLATNEGDIVLDYHLGSGSTAVAAHKMGRRYIGIEQLYYGENDATTRLKSVIIGDQAGISKNIGWQGGGSFVYCNIMNNSNKFRKRVEAAKNDSDYLNLLKEATSSSFLSYRVDPKKLSEDEFRKLSAAEKRRLLLELIDNNTLYVNYEDINDPIFKVSEKDKEFNKKLYEKN